MCEALGKRKTCTQTIIHSGTSTIIEQVRMTKYVQIPYVRLTLIDRVHFESIGHQDRRR